MCCVASTVLTCHIFTMLIRLWIVKNRGLCKIGIYIYDETVKSYIINSCVQPVSSKYSSRFPLCFFGKLTKSGTPGWFLNKIGYLFFRDGARSRRPAKRPQIAFWRLNCGVFVCPFDHLQNVNHLQKVNQ